MFRISSDTVGTLICSAATEPEKDTIRSCLPGKYVAAVYDEAWKAGIIVEKDYINQDVLVNFMRATRSPGSFQWPRKKDECWVPLDHIMCILPVPSTTSSGRQYQFDNDTSDKINNLFQSFAQSNFNTT